jgi:hypothetical protein
VAVLVVPSYVTAPLTVPAPEILSTIVLAFTLAGLHCLAEDKLHDRGYRHIRRAVEWAH